MAWGNLTEKEEIVYDNLYRKYVPAKGKANTLGGELLRAISRLVYRFYNDGDTVYRDYGETYNTLYGANNFLLYHVHGYSNLEYVSDENQYEKKVDANLKLVLSYLENNPAVFQVANEFDFMENCPPCEIDDWDDDDWEDSDDED